MFSSSPEAPNSTQAPNPASAMPTTAIKLAPNATMTGFLVIMLTISLALSVFGVKKYRAIQRSRLLKRQIAMLEALWRISSTK